MITSQIVWYTFSMLTTLYHSIFFLVNDYDNNIFKNIFTFFEAVFRKHPFNIKNIKGEFYYENYKKFISLILVIFVLSVSIIPIYAVENEITPYYNNTATTETHFVIDENGVAWVLAMPLQVYLQIVIHML